MPIVNKNGLKARKKANFQVPKTKAAKATVNKTKAAKGNGAKATKANGNKKQLKDPTLNRNTVRSQKTRQRLVEATIKLVAEVGVEAVSVSEVARRAEVTRPGAYYHFKSREELLDAFREELDDQLLKVIDGSMDVADLYSFPAEVAAEDKDLIQLRIQKMLDQGPSKDILITQRLKQFNRFQKTGRLQSGVDPEMAAIIVSSSLVAAYLAVSEGKTKKQRHNLAKRFGRTYHHLLFYGLLDPESDDWPEFPAYTENGGES